MFDNDSAQSAQTLLMELSDHRSQNSGLLDNCGQSSQSKQVIWSAKERIRAQEDERFGWRGRCHSSVITGVVATMAFHTKFQDPPCNHHKRPDSMDIDELKPVSSENSLYTNQSERYNGRTCSLNAVKEESADE